jgi:hypothetical protein
MARGAVRTVRIAIGLAATPSTANPSKTYGSSKQSGIASDPPAWHFSTAATARSREGRYEILRARHYGFCVGFRGAHCVQFFCRNGRFLHRGAGRHRLLETRVPRNRKNASAKWLVLPRARSTGRLPPSQGHLGHHRQEAVAAPLNPRTSTPSARPSRAGAQDYCLGIPARSMTAAHLAISSVSLFFNASGVLAWASMPRSA